MPNDDQKIARVKALLSEGPTSRRVLLRQIVHDINGPLFAFTLDLDLISEALRAAKAACADGDESRLAAALESVEVALLNLQSANGSATAYVRGVQVLADEGDIGDDGS